MVLEWIMLELSMKIFLHVSEGNFIIEIEMKSKFQVREWRGTICLLPLVLVENLSVRVYIYFCDVKRSSKRNKAKFCFIYVVFGYFIVNRYRHMGDWVCEYISALQLRKNWPSTVLSLLGYFFKL